MKLIAAAQNLYWLKCSDLSAGLSISYVSSIIISHGMVILIGQVSFSVDYFSINANQILNDLIGFMLLSNHPPGIFCQGSR